MKIDFGQVNDTLIVSTIFIAGNYKTKPRIIYNELLFKQYSSIPKDNLDDLVTRSKQNLENTSLFNFVYITYWFENNKEVIFEIRVEERWYSWVLPLFELADRNFSAFLDNGDWNRINYGIYFKQENFRGLNETLKFKVKTGYLQEIELLYESADYNNKIGIGSTLSYNTMNQICYGIYDNNPVYISSNNLFMAQEYSSTIYLHFRHNYVNRHKLYFGYNYYQVQDTIAALNPNYLSDGKTSISFLSLSYKYRYDIRDSKSYPLKGTMLSATITQDGIGVLQKSIQNTSFKLQFSQQGKLASRFYYSCLVNGLANSSNNNAYIINSGYGFDDFIDGYEYNVMESDDYAFTKQKILFELVPTQTKQFHFINLSQFSKIHYAVYLKTFFNHGYVYKDDPNTSNYLSNTYLYSYGVGIDLVTYYDKVLSFNYSINKAGVSGFYVHLNVGI